MKIEVIENVTPALTEAIGRLVAQLSRTASAPSLDHMTNIVSSPATTLFMACTDDGAYSGMLTLVVVDIPTGVKATIEDVVVDSGHRRQGVAEALTREALRRAQAAGARTVDLTSHPSRVAANALYQRLGFTRRETNVYRMSQEALSLRS